MKEKDGREGQCRGRTDRVWEALVGSSRAYRLGNSVLGTRTTQQETGRNGPEQEVKAKGTAQDAVS